MKRIVLSLIATTFLTNLALADDGRFIFPGRAFPLTGASDMVIVDLDGDGFLDVATAGYGIGVTWGTADGRFVDGMAIGPPPYHPTRIAAGDLGSPGDPEPDGLLDLVVGWWEAGGTINSISVFHGLAGRSFVETVLFQAARSAGIAIGDFDGDTYADIAWAYGDTVSVAYNGPAGFTSPFSVPLGAGSWGLASTDLNGDGRADLVVAGNASYTLVMTVLYGQPTQGQFDSRQYTVPGSQMSPRLVSIADFDGDQLLDVAISGNGAGGYVFYGESPDSFVETAVLFTLPYAPRHMAAGDLDGDGRSDLVFADGGDGRNSAVLYGRSSRTFSPPVTFSVGYVPQQVAAADMDSDGRAEVFAYVSGTSGAIAIHRSRPRGKIATRWEVDIPDSRPVSLAAADFNDDGAPDLAIADWGNESVKLFWGGGDGSFEVWGPDLPAGATPQDIASGHLDDDELPDLALTTSSNNLLVWHSDGGGNFQEPPEQFDVGGPQSALTTGDFNNDGRTDVALLAADQLVIFKGLPGGSLDPIPLTRALPDPGVAIAVGHLDMDQYLDLVVCYVRNTPENVLILHGHGDGTFSEHIERFDTGSGPMRVTIGDINADGLGDAVIVNSGNPIKTITSLLAQPGGGFVRQDITVPEFGCPGIADISLADFDLDGVGDVIFAWCHHIALLFG